MNRKTMVISFVIFIVLAVGSYLFILPKSQMKKNQTQQIDLHNRFLVPLYSNHPRESWLLALDPDDHSTESLRIKTSGMRDIVIDSNNQYAWIASYGVEFGVENDYVVAVSLDDGTVHKVKIDGEGPQVIKAENDSIYVLTHDSGFSGHLVKIDPVKLEMSASQELDGFLDAFTINEGKIYVSSFFAGIAADDYDGSEDPKDLTIITRLDADTLTIEAQQKHSVLLNSNDLIEKDGYLYSTDGSNSSATGSGETITKIDANTLEFVDRIDIPAGTNNMVIIPNTDKVLILRNNEGVSYDDLPPPYALIYHPDNSELETMDRIPLLSAAQFDEENHHILWGSTYDGKIIQYSMDLGEIIDAIDLDIKAFEKKEREHVHVNSFVISNE